VEKTWGDGISARLFLNVFLLGTLITMIFSNDATALILTPVVYVFVTRLRLPVLPYLFACTFGNERRQGSLISRRTGCTEPLVLFCSCT